MLGRQLTRLVLRYKPKTIIWAVSHHQDLVQRGMNGRSHPSLREGRGSLWSLFDWEMRKKAQLCRLDLWETPGLASRAMGHSQG